MAEKKNKKEKNKKKEKIPSPYEGKSKSEAAEYKKAGIKKNPAGSRLKDSIVAVLLIAFGIFLILAMLTDYTGTVGRVLSGFFTGCFGLVAYALPFYLIVYSVLMFFQKVAHINSRTAAFTVILFVDLSMLYSAGFDGIRAGSFDFSYIIDAYKDGMDLNNAGAVGMTLGLALYRLVGIAGLIIVSLVILIICVMLVADTPISQFFDNLRIKRNLKKIDAVENKTETGTSDPSRDTAPLPDLTAAMSADKPKQAGEKKKFLEKAFGKIRNRKAALDGTASVQAMPDASPVEYNDGYSVPAADDYGQGEPDDLAETDARSNPGGFFRGLWSKDRDIGNDTTRVVGPGKSAGRSGKNGDGSSQVRAGGGNSASEYEAVSNGGPEIQLYSPGGHDQGSAGSAGNAGQSALFGNDNDKFSWMNGGDDIFSDDQSGKHGGQGKNYGKVRVSESRYPDMLSGADQMEDTVENEAGQAAGGAGNAAAAAAGTAVGAADRALDSAAGRTAGQAAEAAENAAEQIPQKLTKAQMAAKAAGSLAQVNREAENKTKQPGRTYKLPPLSLLNKPERSASPGSSAELRSKAALLEKVLQDFGVDARVVGVNRGPSITRYEVQPATGVKVSSIVRLSDDIALNLRAKSLRIEAPIPGRAAIGIEVQNDNSEIVSIRELIDSPQFRKAKSKISFVVGEDITGNAVVADLKSMPHMLIAGSTGSGKSVCINSIIMSILYRSTPDEVKFILIDPKVVELSNYNGIPHMLIPVVTDPAKAAAALMWAVQEMEGRYKKFAKERVKNLAGYNEKMKKEGRTEDVMTQIVIIIDELADLMMAAAKQVEESICRLAQLARAAGMHMIVATQRPSVDVVTGLIKANVPSRIAFAVSSQVDSRTILDKAGAEKLVGKGDMLFSPLGSSQPQRLQGPFVTDEEVAAVIDFWKGQADEDETPEKMQHVMQEINNTVTADLATDNNDDEDELYGDAVQLVLDAGQASASMLQRRFRIGYNRAGRLIDTMEARGIIGPSEGSRPRRVLMTKEEYEASVNPQGGSPDDVPSGSDDGGSVTTAADAADTEEK